MQRLALLATLLMACAPVVSRWMQSAPSWPAQAMCTTEGLRLADGVLLAHAGHAGIAAQAPDAAPAHADHGLACDYCVLAARVLPMLAFALPVPPVLPVLAPVETTAFPPPTASPWPAHAPRGPPLRA